MSTYTKIWLFAIALAAILYGGSTFAMDNDGFRCNNYLASIGDAEYLVLKNCGEPIATHRVGTGPNGTGDSEYLYYQSASNLTSELLFTDGHLMSVHDIYN